MTLIFLSIFSAALRPIFLNTRVRRPFFGSKIDVQNCHREIVGQFAILVIAVKNTQEFIAEIDFRGIVFAGPRLDHEFLIEITLEVSFQLANFFGFHGYSP
jgi:hypothetical protein